MKHSGALWIMIHVCLHPRHINGLGAECSAESPGTCQDQSSLLQSHVKVASNAGEELAAIASVGTTIRNVAEFQDANYLSEDSWEEAEKEEKATMNTNSTKNVTVNVRVEVGGKKEKEA